MEHLENRTLLSANPVFSQLAASQFNSGFFGSITTSSKTATAPVAYAIFAPPSVQSGVQASIELVAINAYGGIDSSYSGTAKLQSSDTSSSASVPATASFHNGIAYVNVTLATPGFETITASDSTTSTITGEVAIDVVAPDVATSYYVDARPIVQSGVQTSIELYALDSNGYVVKNYDGTADLKYTDETASTSVTNTLPTQVTFHNGIALLNVAFDTTTALTEEVTATDAQTSGLTGSATISVTAPAVAASYEVLLPSSVKAGATVNGTLYAVDSTGHLVSSYDGTVTLTSTEGGAKFTSSSVTFNNGVATFQVSFATAGEGNVTATTAGTNGGASVTGEAFTTVLAAVTPSTGGGGGGGGGGGSGGGGTGGTGSTGIATTTSSNWSGYAVETNLNSPQSNSVTAVSGSWTVPTVTGTGTAYSAIWVGIDGYKFVVG